jgi:hypothetical protein
MTEAEWNVAYDPAEMLQSLRPTQNAHQLWEYVKHCLYGIGADAAVDMFQTHITGNMDQPQFLAYRRELELQATQRSGGGYSQGRKPVSINQATQKARAALASLQQSPWDAADQITQETRHQLQRSQCEWLRCLFANPFRPVTLNPSWLTSSVLALAKGIYTDRAFDRMPILADALQDAGCDNEAILNHCRQSGEHCRGCWAVDLVLGKS